MDIPEDINLKTGGKISNRVYYYIGKKQFSREFFIPNQPGTDGQMAWWQWFALGVRRWKMLSPAIQAEYNQDAKRLHFSGFNLYMREHMNSHP